MATITISLPDPMKDWIEAKVKRGDYTSTSDYVSDLVRKDRSRDPQEELTLEDLRRIVDESRASGVSNRTVEDIREDARREARALGYIGD